MRIFRIMVLLIALGAFRLEYTALAAEQLPRTALSARVYVVGQIVIHQGDANDAEALAGVVRAYLQRTLTSVSQSIDMIRMEISPAKHGSDDVQAADVRVSLLGPAGSEAAKQTMESEIAQLAEQHILGNDEWVVQDEIINFSVRVDASPILEQYEAYYAQNNDMAGWIRIDGTKLDYPVMQTFDDFEFYLNRGFDKKDSKTGLPFLDDRSDVLEPTHNLLVYGHNMKSGANFGILPNYESKSFLSKHPHIRFDLLNEQRIYEVIAMFRSRQYEEDEPGFHYYMYIDLSDINRFNEYIDEVKNASLYDTGLTAVWGDQLLTLSTCSYHADAGTFVVVAKRIA